MIFSLIFGRQILNAQDSIEVESTKLSGSDLKSEDAAAKSDGIFVGKITQIGLPNAKAAGQVAYYGNKVHVLQVLRGAIGAQVKVTLYVHYVSDIPENPPKVDGTYIFFVKKIANPDPDPYKALKLLPATDANIARVQALIAAAPAGK